ncbi:MAG: hypothetical protein CME14_09750 [Gemmatimonadetes bacterium]|nr:hypothetical protein [Gemmatimonadota bacterium]
MNSLRNAIRLLFRASVLMASGVSQAVEPEVHFPKKHFAFFDAYCLDCHDTDTQKGKVDLEALSFNVTSTQQAELWQKVLDAMNAGEMPPEKKTQPKNAEKADFLSDLAQTMVLARKKLSDSGGQITMRRLNRREYQNTIESLTGVSLNVDSLPPDGGSGTFDTEGASQFISSDQFEQYLALGRTAIDEAFTRHSTLEKPTKTFRMEPEESVNPKNLEIIKRLEETYEKKWLPWKEGVDRAVVAPENKEIVAKLRKKHRDYDTNPFLKYQKADFLKGYPDPRDYGGNDPINAVAVLYSGYRRWHSYMKHYAQLPHNDRGSYLKLAWGVQRFDIRPDPKDVPPGTYKLRIRVAAVKGSDPSRHFIQIGHPQKDKRTSKGFAKLLSTQQVSGTLENPEIIEISVVIGANTHRVLGVQERQPKKSLLSEFDRHKKENGYGTPPAIWVDWMELEGPIKETGVQTFRVEPENTVNVQSAKRMKQMEDTYKRYLGWKAGVDKAALAPENQEAIEQIRKKYKLTELIGNLRLYQNADLLKGVPDAKKFGFKDSNDASFSYQGGYGRTHAYLKHYAALPLSDRGTYLKLGWGIKRVDITPPKDKFVPGNYKLRIRAGSVEGSDPNRHFIQIGYPQRNNQVPAGFVGKPISGHQVKGTTENPEIIETIVKIGSGSPHEFGIQERQPEDGNLHRKEFYRLKRENGYGFPPAVWIDWMELEGPIRENQAPELEITRVEPEKTINPANEEFIKQVEARQERFKQWKKGVDEAAKSPENQAIIAEIRKTDRLIDHPNRFYGYAEHFKGAPDPSEFGFLDSKKAAASDPSRSKNLALHKHYASLPHRDTGTYLKLTLGTGRVIVPRKKKELQPGNYVVRVRVGAVKGTPASRRFIEVGHPQRDIDSRNWGLKGKPISVRQVTGTIDAPQIIEFPIELRSDMPQEFAVQEKQPNTGKLKVLWDDHNKLRKENGYGHPPAIWIDWVELEGPLHDKVQDGGLVTILQNNLHGAVDTEEERARTIFQRFCVEAFRQVEPDPEFIDQLVGLYKRRITAGDSFEVAIRTPMSVILASPGFIYLDEPNTTESKRTLTDRELAVRLAYFLWSAPPDAKLFDLAKRNELSKPAVLRQQVNRMIADPRADEFVAGFVHQWLNMERLDFFQFDTKLHREFDESVRASARKEVYESFAHLLRDDEGGRLGKLLKSDYVMINGLLGTYYGIEGVTGDEFRKVSLPSDIPRGGLLSTAAVLAMGSDGIESSPVERGAWVLRYLLNDPPPPAPANVPQLSRLADTPLTTRERVLAHQEEPQCANCHRKIDPIGFGLENFTAAGKWRTQDGHGKRAYDIDPSGKFHNGPEFANYFELRDRIAERENDFARGFTEALIGYGLGRPFGFTDQDLAVGIIASAKKEEFSVIEFIHALVQSKAFATK